MPNIERALPPETNLEYPIMIGIDHFKRPFVTMKYLYNCEYTKTKSPKLIASGLNIYPLMKIELMR